jgi:hypothetical protein
MQEDHKRRSSVARFRVMKQNAVDPMMAEDDRFRSSGDEQPVRGLCHGNSPAEIEGGIQVSARASARPSLPASAFHYPRS